VRKAADQVQHERRQKRGGGRVLGAAALDGAEADAGGGLEAIAGREPSPAFAALVADEVRRRLAALRDESLRRVALLRLEGYTNEEIAERQRCSLRTVKRRLALIRRTWEAVAGESGGP
jgi:DNA-directed RNA polymerase specialized sigma24 family protein